MVIADKYYGRHATGYDAARQRTARWAAEQAAVEAFVSRGPVLDVPVGTGRYFDIYRAQGLEVTGLDISPDMIAEARSKDATAEIVEGSIFAMPFSDGQFSTVVCTRLLDWLCPQDMERAVAELRRVAKEIVVSIRHGKEGIVTNWTHDLARFHSAIDGMYIAGRATTERTEKYGLEEILHLRPPEWSDVLDQFPSSRGGPLANVNRIANVWVGRLLEREVDLGPETPVRAEYWTAERLWSDLARMAELWDEGQPPASCYITSQPPRYYDRPLTILRAQGSHVILDGRRRINRLRGKSGTFPVLVVEA